MTFKEYLKPLYRKLFPDHVYHLKKELRGCDLVLDLGCGPNSSLQDCKIPFSVGVELFEPYLKESQKKGIHNQYVKKDIAKVNFDSKSFDAVIIIDVIEHINKEDGKLLLKKAENWAKKKIIIFTPNGFIGQNAFDENYLQAHISGWSTQEFEKLGFRCFGLNGWKILRTHRAAFKKPIFFYRFFSELSQKIVYYYPKHAFHIFAVKNIK